MRKLFLVTVFIAAARLGQAQQVLKLIQKGRSIIFTNTNGERLRLTPYGDHIIRVQVVRKNEDFFSDDRYEMVVTHQWPGNLILKEDKTSFTIRSGAKDGMLISLDKASMSLSFSDNKTSSPFLKETGLPRWNADTIQTSFVYDPTEHFTGLGHGYYGREESLDLQGKTIRRNYGSEHIQQAPLIVPFYLSGKGYGVFLNSTFPNKFSFGENGVYAFSLEGKGRMDYFVIDGPAFASIIDRYTQLTGRPRLPLKAFFGLGLSDKGNDEHSTDPSDEQWWKKKITAHRNAGFPIDHIINDNRWRAGGGQRCVSYFAWDSGRYPHPQEYGNWVRSNGLILTLDFNRCIAVQSEGWKPFFNLPKNEGIDFNTSAPDLTKKETREWFWNIMWNKSLNPALGYPGDALWIDEFDEMGKAPLTMKFADGTTWEERKNYWFFLVAKAIVQEGWDKKFKGTKRPFVWVRGMTAGAQRYATLWSGDIRPTYADMKTQVRALQLAGLSGFPFWGHDAGGFYDYDLKQGPTDTLYRQWSMAFGSFTPFWKPHGVGASRWPLDRPAEVQKDALRYCRLRYQLIPYIYSYAHIANQTGLAVARAMVIDHQNEPIAWQRDLQYMWGNELLVAPNCSDDPTVSVWLPEGQWYDYWNDASIKGGKVINYNAPIGKLPLFVKAGSIIPMANFALSTAFIHNDSLILQVYPGKDGKFDLYEDDGVTEAYRDKNEKRNTTITFKQSSFSLNIGAAIGDYKNAPSQRAYEIVFHSVSDPFGVEVNGVIMKTVLVKEKNNTIKEGAVWVEHDQTLTVFLKRSPVKKMIVVKRIGSQ